MKKQDALSIIITFLVGVVAGVYMYLGNAAGWLAELATPDATEVATAFVIVGDVYGGCRTACPSFQVSHDGSYRYLYTPAAGAEQVLREGTLPRQLQRQLTDSLTPAALAAQSQAIQPAVCNSYTDGIDVVYDISYAGEQYTLDSCGTAVVAESVLWVTLGDIWTHFESSGNNF